MIFLGSQAHKSHRQCCLNKLEVNAIETIATLMWLRWSEMAITFSQDDHPNHVPHPGCYPLVVSLSWEPPAY